MSKYATILGSASPTFGGAKRAYDIVAALAPPSSAETQALAKAGEQSPSVTSRVFGAATGAVPWVAGGAAGAFLWKKHRVLGFMAGGAVATNVMGLYRGGVERSDAMWNLGIEGAAIGGALMMEDHPVLGYLGGLVAGHAVASFFPSSPQHKTWQQLKAKMGMKG